MDIQTPDRKNRGTIISVNHTSGIVKVRIMNKDTKNYVIKEFSIDDVKPPKAGKASKTPKETKIDPEAKRPTETEWFIDKKASRLTWQYITTDDLSLIHI